MSIILVKAFAGTKPRVSERLLDNSNAQVAINCDLDQGSLRPLNGPASVQALSGATIFKDQGRWFSWPQRVSVARMPVSSENQRIGWTGDEYPKVSDVTSFPSFKRLGVLPPLVAPSVAFEANPDYSAPTTTITAENFDEAYYLSSNPDVAAAITAGDYPGTAWEHYSQYGRTENRPARAEGDGVPDEEQVEIARSSVYAYTAVNEWGEESKLSPPSPVIEVRASQLPQVQGLARPAAPGMTITKFRIYRVAVGSQSSDFQFVAEIDSGLSFYLDKLTDAELGEVCPTAGFDPPPDDLMGLLLSSNGLMFGFRKNEIYPSEQFIPYAFPRAYMVKTESEIVGIGAYGNTVVACTKTRPYAITGINPESMNVLQLPFNQSCIGADSIVSVEGGVIYASPDGLFMVSGNGSGQLLTASILTKEQWATYQPDKIIATWFDNKYYGFQQGSGKGFILDIERGDIVDFDLGNLAVTAVHYSPWDDTLYLLSGGTLYAWGSGSPLTLRWKSKCYSTQMPIPMSSGRVFGGGGNTVKYFANGAEVFSSSVTDREIYRLPGGDLINEHEFEVSGTAEVHEVKFATSNEEMGLE